MKHIIIIIYICLIAVLSNGYSQNVNHEKMAAVSFYHLPIDKSELENEIIRFLHNTVKNIKSPNSTIRIINKKESIGGIHISYEQYFNGIPIYRSQSKVNLDKKGIVRSCLDNTFNTNNWSLKISEQAWSLYSDNSKTEKYVQAQYESRVTYTRQVMIYFDAKNELPIPVSKLNIKDRDGYIYDEVLLDTKGKAIHQRNLNVYHSGDSLVKAKVFSPDPLTTLNVQYGAPYIDNNDANSSVLNNTRKPVDMKVNYTFGTFSLYNSYLKIAKINDIGAEDSVPITSVTPFFYFNRASSAFEDVNAFFHLSYFINYIKDTLGFTSLITQQVKVDTHADVEDDSWFSSSNGPKLYFGVGGVDDAEDADVLIHEFGHALSYFASPGTNSGYERNALDEGLGDYFAASYSRSINSNRWEDVFTWDGHNEYWNGRDAASSKHYPEDKLGIIHLDGEIWSSVLMQIWEEIGRKKTDQLVLESVHGWTAGMSMKTAAQLVIQSDSIINDGANFLVLHTYFVARGLIDPTDSIFCQGASFPIDAGDDTTIFRGDLKKFKLGGSPTGNINAVQYKWVPSKDLNDNTIANPTANVVETITYYLTIEYPETPSYCFKYDKITITVKDREEIHTQNPLEFIIGKKDLTISLPSSATSTIVEVFDTYGRLIFKKEIFENYNLNSDLFNTGVFLVRITSQGEKLKKTVKKIVKVQ